MPKYIEVGDDVVEFPDNMTDADIERALSAQFAVPATQQPAMPQAEQARQPSVPDQIARQFGLTARAGISGLASLPAMLAEPIAQGVNLVAGRQVFPNQTEAVQRALTAIGLPEPQTATERAVQAGASAMAGVGGQSELARRAASPFLAPFTQSLGQQTAAAGAAGAAGQATADRAQEVGLSPEATVAATLAAGTLAGLTGSSLARNLQRNAVQPVTIDQVKQEAQRAYNRVDSAGINVKPAPLLGMVDDIETNLINKSNFNPQLEAHRPVKQVLDQMRQMVGTQRVSFSKLDQLRQAANNLARESRDPATRRLASEVVAGVDKKITGLQPNDLISGQRQVAGALNDIKEARDAWRRVSKATVLEDALNVAEARALAPTASEGDLIRNQFKAIAANKDKMRLFSKDEQEAIRQVVSGKGVQPLLSLIGRFNPERSQLVTGGTVFLGTQNPALAAGVAGAGFAADKAQSAIQRRATQDLIARILRGEVQRPTTANNWRALLEAQIQSYNSNPLAASGE